MKKLSLYIFLVFTWCNAGFADIKEFALEGMSIGDIFSDHYDLETQKKLKKINSENGITVTQFTDSEFTVYDEVMLTYSTVSQRIKSIVGIIYLPEMQNAKDWLYGENGAIQICLDKQDEITNDIAKLRKSTLRIGKINEWEQEKSQKKSLFKTNEIIFSQNGLIRITCEDWNSEILNNKYRKDRLLVSIIEKKTDKERVIKSTDNFISENSKKSKFKSNDKNYALLIANNEYKYWEDLQSPINDIDAIGSILKNDYGFDVEVIKNSDRDTILDKIFEYSKKITDKDNLLIYYAGNGEIINSNAYWIPKNGTKEISSKWLNTKDVESAISMIKAKDLLVMIDACFQGTAFKSGKKKIIGPTTNEMNEEKYFTKMLNFRSAVVITSGSNEPVVDATIKGHSNFAFKFIDILKKNIRYETSTSMFVELKKYHASLMQSPQIIRMTTWGDLGGDFIFLKN